MVEPEATDTVGFGLTDTVRTPVLEQVPDAPIMLYVVVTVGLGAIVEVVALVFQV
jgi:hypothetical protein